MTTSIYTLSAILNGDCTEHHSFLRIELVLYLREISIINCIILIGCAFI